MEGNMKIEVPITIKGGKEGDKVGKQIGDKIAATLNKSLKSIGFGGTSSSAAPSSGGSSKLLGMSKGIGMMVTKLGVIGVIAGTALGLMKKSSGYLKGVLSIFGRAITIFFRPFGDFLAGLLRPLAIMLMKAAVAFLKFSRTGIGNNAVGTTLGAGAGALTGAAIGAVGGPIGAGAGALIGAGLGLLASLDWEEIYNKMTKFGSWLWDKIKSIWDWTADFGGWLWEKITSIWSWTEDVAGWLWEKVVSIWNWSADFGSWLWEQVKSIWNWTANLGSWLWGKIKSIWNWSFDMGSWLVGKIKGIWSWNWDVGDWLKGKIKSIFSSSSSDDTKGYATGTAFVPETGMYQLHRGESVVPRVQNTNNKAQSIVMNPTINVMGGSSNVDGAAIAKQFNNTVINELKSRGIL